MRRDHHERLDRLVEQESELENTAARSVGVVVTSGW